MADYRLTSTPAVIRTSDDASIPSDPNNRDRQIYDQWLAEGNIPDPAIVSTPGEANKSVLVAFDHENRLRTLEGSPLLTLSEFLALTGL